MMHKKRFIILASISLIALMVILVPYVVDITGIIDQEESSEVESSESVTDHSHGSGHAQTSVEFKTIDDYVLYSNVIITGHVVDISSYNSGTDEVVVEVVDQLKGNSDTYINVYTFSGDLREGQHYLMFLEKTDNKLFPAPIHALVGEPNLFIIEDNKVLHSNPNIESNLDLSKLKEAIVQSEFIDAPHPLREPTLEKRINIAVENPSIDVLMEQSDFVVYLRVDDIIEEHRYFNALEANILNQVNLNDDVTFKLEKDTYLYLPGDVKEGEKYLVFYQLGEGAFDLTSREGSVISEKDAAFDEVAKQLNITK